MNEEYSRWIARVDEPAEQFEQLSNTRLELEQSKRQLELGLEPFSASTSSLFEKPHIQAFADTLINAITKTDDPSWTLYALRHMPLLTFPTKPHTRISVGETIYYSTEYEKYAEAALEVWQSMISRSGFVTDEYHPRGFRIIAPKKELEQIFDAYHALLFRNAPPTKQRP
jgi:hypothetical protein